MRLSRGHRRWVYSSSAALFTTGVLWLAFHYFVHVEGELGTRPHPLEHWWLMLHGAGALVFLVVAGSLLPIHVRRGWHQRRNLPLGLALGGVVLLLTASGYALYYFGGEETRSVISLVHWIVGLGAPAVLVYHVLKGRASLSPGSLHAHGSDLQTNLRWRVHPDPGQGKGPSASA